MNLFAKWAAKVALSTLVVSGTAIPARADVKLHPIFTDDMVLQRGKPVSIWGTASPGERVTVQITSQQRSALADAGGEWRVTFDALAAMPSTPFSVQGQNKIELKNVAVGEVWVCSGQSNMEWPLSDPQNAAADIAGADFPDIRLLTIPKAIAGTPQRTFAKPVEWRVCTPQTAIGFSAVAYHFGREISKRLDVPIGLINASCGGSVAQAWMSAEALTARNDLRDAALQTRTNVGTPADLRKLLDDWLKTYDVGTQQNWQSLGFDDAAWKRMNVPGLWENNELPGFDGIVWFRQSVEVPVSWGGRDLTLRLGTIDDRDVTFFNGQRIGETNGWNHPRVYKIPGSLVKAGWADIAVRIYDIGDGGGFGGNGRPCLVLADDPTQKIDLPAVWKYRESVSRKDMPPSPFDVQGNQDQPTGLFNGVIAPLLPFTVRGAIWYQGESNAGAPDQYRTLFPELIRDWRTQWKARQDGSEFGFFFVQLANYMARSEEPVQSGWAELREAQALALSVPRTAMANAIDIGEAGDIHPRNKQDVGKRLALAALAVEYGQPLEYSGPMFKAMEVEEGRIRLEFSHATGMKTRDGAPPRSFAIAGEDGKWFAADARIENESVVVSSDRVPAPKSVRYAWMNNPDVNLVNSADLPAVAFRTDSP